MKIWEGDDKLNENHLEWGMGVGPVHPALIISPALQLPNGLRMYLELTWWSKNLDEIVYVEPSD